MIFFFSLYSAIHYCTVLHMAGMLSVGPISNGNTPLEVGPLREFRTIEGAKNSSALYKLVSGQK